MFFGKGKERKMVENFARTVSMLRQHARKNGISESKFNEVVMQLQSIIQITGEYTHSRVVLNPLGKLLLQDEVRTLVPICHAWDELPVFGSAIPSVVQKHIEFLKTVCTIAPQVQPIFLVADTEASDNLLLRSLQRQASEFLSALQGEQAVIESLIRLSGWRARMMTSYIPDLLEREARARAVLSAEDRYRQRLITLALDRQQLYQRMGISDPEEQSLRTVQVAAQYMALALYAEENGTLMVTHTTTNVMWYRECGVAVLHNPNA